MCSALGHVRFTPESDIKCDMKHIDLRALAAAAESLIAAYEWVKERKPYREWLISSSVLNKIGQVKLADLG